MNSSACYRIGRVEYQDGLDLMRRWGTARLEGLVSDTLFLLEHSPVITLGRGATRENIVATPGSLKSSGVDVYETDRGGDVTYHGPGQLVGYPVFLLPPGRQDVRRYVRDVEEAIIRALASFDISAHRESKWPGVWTRNAFGELLKICAIGVHLSKWLTRHGFALNVNTDMSHFEFIVPCGIRQAGVVSMQQLLGSPIDMQKVEEAVRKAFTEVFDTNLDERPIDSPSVALLLVNNERKIWINNLEDGTKSLPHGICRQGESHSETAQRLAHRLAGISEPLQDIGLMRAYLKTGSELALVREKCFFGTIQVPSSIEYEGEWIFPEQARDKLPVGAHLKAVQMQLLQR